MSEWWAIRVAEPRTGVAKLVYVEAPNENAALGAGGPGASYIGGPYATEQDAENAQPGVATAPGSSNPNSGDLPTDGASPGTINANPSQIPNPLTAIGDFFGRLEEGSTWIRIGEVLLGIVLIALGVAKMTNAVPVATNIAKAVK